jgi:cytochrome c-type biogenesis protein CcmH/NrfG
LDATAVWFQRGEDEAAMAETPLAKGSEPRRLSTMAWVAGGVMLTAAIFVGVVLHLAHAARVVEEPLAIPAAAATAPAAAPATQPAPVATQPAAEPAPATPPAAQPSNDLPATRAPASASSAPASSASTAGEKLLRHGHAAAALAAFQQTLAHDPDDIRSLRGACVALGKLGRMNDGARVCRRALERAPRDVETRRALATIYYNGGAYKWSATEWRRVVDVAPHDVAARRALRKAEARAGRG